MEIKVGDKVRVSKDAPGIYMKTIFPNLVSSNMEVTEIGYGFARIKPLICECEYLTFEFAIPTKYLIKVDDEAKEAKFKKGDKVVLRRFNGASVKAGSIGEVWGMNPVLKHFYDVAFDGGGLTLEEKYLELYTEPKEQTEAEKKPNIGSIKIPVEVDLTDSYWDAYAADLAKEIALKVANKYNAPQEAADYAVSVAKAVVENLKKK